MTGDAEERDTTAQSSQPAASAAAGDPIRLVDEPGPIDLDPVPGATERPTRLSDAAEAALAGLADRPISAPRVAGSEQRSRAPGVESTLWTPSEEVRDAGEGRSADGGEGPSGHLPRIVISHLDTQRDERDVRVVVTLRCASRVAHGEATAVPTTHGLFRAIAEATLAAVRALSARTLLVGVDRVSVQQSIAPATATVVLSLLTRAGEETLVGSALVRADADGAVMRATLDAINRRITPYLEAAATA